MNKKIMFILTLCSTFLFFQKVNAETVNYTYTNDFSESIGNSNNLVSNVEGTAKVLENSLYMVNGTYAKYTVNSNLLVDKLIFEFDFKKNNSDSYSRLLYLGGINREIEIKGSSNTMYIKGDVSAGWLQNEWNHMKIEYNNSSIKYYVNDVMIKEENYTGIITFIQFGKGSSESNYFNGWIDNLNIYATTEKLDDSILPIDNAWFKGRIKIDSSSKSVYVKSNIDDDYTLLFQYTKKYFVLSEKFGSISFVESDNDSFYYSKECSYNSESFTCFLNKNGDTNIFHTLEYSLSSKSKIRDMPIGESYGIDNVKKANVNIYSLSDNSVLYSKNYNMPDTDITITEEEVYKETILDKDYITAVKINISFSNINNDIYAYMYKFSDEYNWSTITLTSSSSFSKKYEKNGTLYVKIVDKNTNDIVVSKTYTLSKIEEKPNAPVKEDTINTSPGKNDVIFHKCTINLEVGYALCKIEFNNFDNDTYKYFYRVGDEAYIHIVPDEKTKVLPKVYDDSLLLNTNDDISLYKKWTDAKENPNQYLLPITVYKNTTISVARQNRNDNSVQYYTFTITSFNENAELNQILDFFNNVFFSKLGFIHQTKEIITNFFAFSFDENAEPPSFTFDLSFINLKPVTVNMEVDNSTRLLVHSLIKTFASIFLLITFTKQMVNFANHQKEE